MARDVSMRLREGLRAILIQGMSAAKSVRVQRDRLLQLRRRLKQRIPGDDGEAVVQDVAAGLFKVYFRGLEYASRYFMSFLEIALRNGARLDDLNPAFTVIPKEQLYDVLLAQRLPARPTTRADAFARIEVAFNAVKLAEEHHVPRCIELLVGILPPTVTGKPLPFSGMTGYSDDPVTAAQEHLAKNGFPNLAEPPREARSVDLDLALSYLHRACSLASLAVKHTDLAVAILSSFLDPKELADTAEDTEKFTYIPDLEVHALLALSISP
jgi:hypothetical protein